MFSVLGFVVVIGLNASCAHKHTVQGHEPASQIPEGTRVGIGGKEIKEGDTVDVLQSFCHSVRQGRSKMTECHDKKAGEAVVLKVLDHDSAIVQPQNNLVMDNEMKVEKQQ